MAGFFQIPLCSSLTLWPLKPHSFLSLSFICLPFLLISFSPCTSFSLWLASPFLTNLNPLPEKKIIKPGQWHCLLQPDPLLYLIFLVLHLHLPPRAFLACLYSELCRAGPICFLCSSVPPGLSTHNNLLMGWLDCGNLSQPSHQPQLPLLWSTLVKWLGLSPSGLWVTSSC